VNKPREWAWKSTQAPIQKWRTEVVQVNSIRGKTQKKSAEHVSVRSAKSQNMAFTANQLLLRTVLSENEIQLSLPTSKHVSSGRTLLEASHQIESFGSCFAHISWPQDQMLIWMSLVGFSADAPVYTADGAVAGVQLRDVGIGKDGKEKDTFEPGEMQCRAISNRSQWSSSTMP
jgi:hypothetical protein